MNLRNYFLHIYWFLKYPKTILPSKMYIHKINVDKIINKNDFYVVRRVPSHYLDSIYKLNGTTTMLRISSATKLNKVVGFSMNILGAKYSIKHLKYIAKYPPISNTWNGKVINFISCFFRYRKCIEVDNNCIAFVYKASSLHNKEVPYLRTFEKEKDFKAVTDAIEVKNVARKFIFCKRKPNSFVGNIKLMHSPINFNYWHIILSIFPEGSDEPLSNMNGKWKEDICDYVYKIYLSKNFMVVTSQKNSEYVNTLDSQYYINNA